ncbi:respiratory nitrate reductase subunit gamma [Boudabousia liubingyangii]|uniref:Nitrate reductase-like protein NarX n=1 Tax=Boudabousia liubingyangii TaxID=1921764 RepID=A0A1Q5PQ25_9ACTO|nr:respiratory nitrate reductase subunit gamma [Boudabousia liubingyangii]OKL49637.1 respiratory nitrate reductase subunit gamma [Boudabousia liubingyangii]
MEFFLWVAFPYICLTLLIGGMIWRWKTDQFGWTSRSSQMYESKILRISSPLFHLGIIFVGIGHIMGLVFPKAVTNAMGVSEHSYHLVATIGGTVAGIMTILGLIGLLYRRFVIKSVRLATSRNDKIMYVLLLIPICLGATATTMNQIFGQPGGYDYRETIGPWFRSLFMLQPDPALMADVPLTFKMHIVAGFLLFAVWPFTRLVHVVSAPVGYMTRPYVVYRSREAATGTTPTPSGWQPVDRSSDDYYTGGARPSGA